MNLKQIEAFVRITNNKSFSQTAREMDLTQPTVSAAIRSLEEELGVTLFLRSTRGISLTEDGKKIFMYARQMLEAEEAIKEACQVTSEHKELNQQILIASSTVPTQYILPSLLAEFHEKFPEIQFSIRELDSIGVIEAVQGHEVDLGFCGTSPRRKNCTYIPFCEDQLVVAVPNTKEYQKKSKEPVGNWLPKESFIMREEGSGTRKEAMRKLKEMGIDPESLNVIASMNNPDTILKSVSHGVGITVISEHAAKDFLEQNKILAIPVRGDKSGRWIDMVFNAAYSQSKETKEFVRFVKKKYKV